MVTDGGLWGFYADDKEATRSKTSTDATTDKRSLIFIMIQYNDIYAYLTLLGSNHKRLKKPPARGKD